MPKRANSTVASHIKEKVMAVSYFMRQNNARSNTAKLIALYVFGIFAVPLVLLLLWFILEHTGETPAHPLTGKDYINGYLGMVLVCAVPVLLASFYYYHKYSGDGSKTAIALGAHHIDDFEPDFKLTQYKNVVEELCVASGLPMPQIFVLEDPTINAFAAGSSPEKAAVCVNTGTLDKLTRRELQGVLAHEFSHIANRDTKINITICALMGGFGIVTTIGYVLFRMAGRCNSRNSKNNPAAAFLIAGLAAIILGWLWSLISHLIQAAVSRQREFLADATAVQYLKDDSIACALEKIRDQAVLSFKNSPLKDASSCAHMCFTEIRGINKTGLFDSHPNLNARITAARDMSYTIEKNYDPLSEENMKKEQETKEREEREAMEKAKAEAMNDSGQ